MGFLFRLRRMSGHFVHAYMDVKISLSDLFIQKLAQTVKLYEKSSKFKVLHVVLCASFARKNRTKIFLSLKTLSYAMIWFVSTLYIFMIIQNFIAKF